MRLQNIFLLYRARLRTRLVQELFAVLGIAVGVALLFASQIASSSLDGSVQQLVSGVVGNMRLQLAARSPAGFDERLLGEVLRLPGVRFAEPVVEVHANAIGPTGQQPIELVSTNPRFAGLGGALTHHFTAAQLTSQQALALPLPVAQSIGALSLQPVRLQIGARVEQAFLGAVLLERDIGGLIHSFVAIAPIAYVQQLADMPGRLTNILVQPYRGRDREVRAGLMRVAAGRLNVEPADFNATLFDQASGPVNKSALLFSAISALVGFLFAFNAMLLTVPQRRHLVADLRLDGYSRRMIVDVLLFDALVLGAVATLLGLLLGDLLSLELFRSEPGYLSFAFALGSQRVITWQDFALACGGGLLAAFVGVLAPLRADLFAGPSLGVAAVRPRGRATVAALLAGLLCMAVTTAILLAAPQDAIVGIVSLVAAVLLLLPSLVRGIVLALDFLRRPITGAAPYLAVIELKSSANGARSLAIAATGAIAVFGSVAIEGARANLLRGMNRASRDLAAITDVWVTAAGAHNVLATTPFRAVAARTLEGLPDVRAVHLLRAGFLDYGDRRVWVIGAPGDVAHPVPPSQIVAGDLAVATARLRRGGWAIVSEAIAIERHLRIGAAFTLPSPRPIALRVAALSTNLGWPPGTIILNTTDYARAWGSRDVGAYAIALRPGVSAERGRREVLRALGPASGLTVETARAREQRQRATTRSGLSRLTQITTLVLVAATLAMAAAMGAMIWQRRPVLADMKVDGFGKGVLWRSLLVECALLLGAGCSIGALFGLYGQLLLSHALAVVTGFPVVYSIGALVAVGSVLLVTAVAVLIVAIPGYLAARVRPEIILQD